MINFNNLHSSPNTLTNPSEIIPPRSEARAIGRKTMDFTEKLARLQAAQKQMEASYARTSQSFDSAQEKALDIARRTSETIKHNRV
jgi:hypothetical protein